MLTSEPQSQSDTATAMHPLVGKVGDLHSKHDYPLTVQVKVLDVRPRWGSLDYLIAPVAGSGEKWVSSERVTDLRTPDPATTQR